MNILISKIIFIYNSKLTNLIKYIYLTYPAVSCAMEC